MASVKVLIFLVWIYLESCSVAYAGKFFFFVVLIILVEYLPTINKEVNKYPNAITDTRLQRLGYLITV